MATQEELRWLEEFMAAKAENLARTTGQKVAENFKSAMGDADPEVQVAWLETVTDQVDVAAGIAADALTPGDKVQDESDVRDDQDDGDGTDSIDKQAIAERLYNGVFLDLATDDMVPDESDHGEIWQDCLKEASSWDPEGDETEVVTRIVDAYTMRLMERVDGDEIYRIVTEFIDEIKQLLVSES